jgi:hypothetical protein
MYLILTEFKTQPYDKRAEMPLIYSKRTQEIKQLYVFYEIKFAYFPWANT